MLKRCDPYKLTEEKEIKRALAQWAWDSHYWIEGPEGYFKCKWCGIKHISYQGLSIDFPLCKENEVVKKLKSQLLRIYCDCGRELTREKPGYCHVCDNDD